MSVRNPKRRCRNCPEEAHPVNEATQPASPGAQPSLASEGPRLWSLATTGMTSFVSMIEGYAALGAPGVPVEAIKGFIARLQGVLRMIEDRNELRRSPERLLQRNPEIAQDERPIEQPNLPAE